MIFYLPQMTEVNLKKTFSGPMIKLSGSYTGSAYYNLNDPFNTGLSEINAQVRSVHIKHYNSKFIREGAEDEPESAVRKEQLFLYDHTGHLVEERIASKDGLALVRKFYIYDEHNKLVEIDIFGIDQVLHEKWIFRYDDHGNNIEQEHYFSQSTLIEKWKFTFDEHRKLVEEHKYGNNILLERWTYRKTGASSSEQCRYISDSLPDEKWESAYDEKGRRVSAMRFMRDGSLFEKYKFRYDIHGSLVGEIIENTAESNISLKKIDYIYDKRGNWICMIEYRNSEPQVMIKRSIRYQIEHRIPPAVIQGLNFRKYTIYSPGLNS